MPDYDMDIDIERSRELAEDGPGAALAEPVARVVPSTPRARAEAGRAEAGDGEPSAPLGGLDQYIRSLGSPRVLTKEETFELAGSMGAAREEFAAEMYAIPGTAVKLLERWHARRRAGHVTAALSARYRDASGKNPGPQIDRALLRVERLLERRQSLAGSARGSAAPELTDLDAQIARAAKGGDIAFEIVREIYLEMCALRDTPRTRATLEARRRLGLNEPAQRARLERARRALERMERDKQTFVVHNLRLVIKQARRFRNMGVPYLDLIQEANLGLIRAVEKFDYSLGYRFSTYAVWWIDQALVRAVQNASRTVRVPTHIFDLEIRLRRVRERLRTRLGRAPTPEELAEALGVTAEEVAWATKAMQATTSTQATLPGTEEFTLEDVLADEDASEPIEAVHRAEVAVRLGKKLEGLQRREREIIEARFGLSGAEPLTLQQIGDRLGLSRERVRQIEARALAQLQREAEADGLRAALDLA